MKKLLIVLALCVFAVSCCEVDHNNSQEKKPTKITATSFKVCKESEGWRWCRSIPSGSISTCRS